eukprot:1159452-Pelagomonas_calceolata.AAC.2
MPSNSLPGSPSGLLESRFWKTNKDTLLPGVCFLKSGPKRFEEKLHHRAFAMPSARACQALAIMLFTGAFQGGGTWDAGKGKTTFVKCLQALFLFVPWFGTECLCAHLRPPSLTTHSHPHTWKTVVVHGSHLLSAASTWAISEAVTSLQAKAAMGCTAQQSQKRKQFALQAKAGMDALHSKDKSEINFHCGRRLQWDALHSKAKCEINFHCRLRLEWMRCKARTKGDTNA